MDLIKELWVNKKDANSRKELTVFFINIFLILVHLFLMVVYIYIKHNFMIVVNAFSLLYYFVFLFRCVRCVDYYIGITFLEIWLHMIFATLSFGWSPCFQSWGYAILTASFLPAFNSENHVRDNKKALFFALVVILTYFGLRLFVVSIDLKIMYPLSDFITNLLFVVNNLISFFTIIMFAYFYTSTRNRKETELTRKADFDELTNLYNRYSINQIGYKIIEDAKNNNKPYSVAILDIDFFKSVNDKYGHASGDMVLSELADILKNYSHGKIVTGRWGGEEFVILAPCNVRYFEFNDILKRLKNKINKHKFVIENDQVINLTVSIGASAIYDYQSLEKAISIADNNLYKAKNTGRNKIVS